MMKVSQFDKRLYRSAFRAYGFRLHTYLPIEQRWVKAPPIHVIKLGDPCSETSTTIPVERVFKDGEPVVFVQTRTGIPRIELAPEDAKVEDWLALLRAFGGGPTGAHSYIVFPKGTIIVAQGFGYYGIDQLPAKWVDDLAIVPSRSIVYVHTPGAPQAGQYFVFYEDDVHVVYERDWRVYLAVHDDVWSYAQPKEIDHELT